MSTIKYRFPLRESKRKRFLRDLLERFGFDVGRMFGDRPQIEVIGTFEDSEVFIVNGKPLLLRVGEDVIPTLVFDGLIGLLPKVIIDMGAIPHVCNGADIMAPGIVRIEGEFKEGDYAVVLDERHGKAIAIVKALLDSERAKSLKHGKIFKNLHHVGDTYWRIIRELSGDERVKT
ncbi:MAG: PUA domain-containing protein [Candidatus Bathyarchaeia archaeon]